MSSQKNYKFYTKEELEIISFSVWFPVLFFWELQDKLFAMLFNVVGSISGKTKCGKIEKRNVKDLLKNEKCIYDAQHI